MKRGKHIFGGKDSLQAFSSVSKDWKEFLLVDSQRSKHFILWRFGVITENKVWF